MRRLGPGVLRIGGNTLDHSWWTSDEEQPPTWATNVVTPSDLASLQGLLTATGWRAILGVDLGHYDPARAANEAATAERLLGSRLLGVEIGNEPNAYGTPMVKLRPDSYTVSSYLKELATYRQAIRMAAPQIRLYGPDFSLPTWLPTVASQNGTSFAAITLHYYAAPFRVAKSGVCEATPVPTALELLSPQVREQENATLAALIHGSALAGREARISETNTTPSCHGHVGSYTNPVFASALWSLDWTLRAASAGVAGLNFHGYFGQCSQGSFSPICTPGQAAEIRGQAIARPEYYGLLAARQLEGGHFIPVHLAPPASGSDLTAYATQHTGGNITLAIDNFNVKGFTRLLLKASRYRRATEEILTAPSISSTSDVTLGHARFDAAGTLGLQKLAISQMSSTLQLELAPASAVIVRLYK